MKVFVIIQTEFGYHDYDCYVKTFKTHELAVNYLKSLGPTRGPDNDKYYIVKRKYDEFYMILEEDVIE